METNYKSSGRPDFSTLSSIMQRFHAVPYHQFQRELDDWITEGIQSSPHGNSETNKAFLLRLRELASSIYHEAELKQLLKETEVNDSHG